MKLAARDACVFTGKHDLEPLAALPGFPVFMGCTDLPPEEDLRADMRWEISRGSGSVQLNPLLPLEVLYRDQHNEAVGKVWTQHHAEFARFVRQYNPKAVLEIGAAHGLLARAYQDLDAKTDWTILEPNPRIVEGCRARVLRGFFDDSFRFAGPLDTVVHSHVLEHMYQPLEFIGQLARFIPEGAHHIFTLPNMQAQLKSFYTNCLNFEHTVFLPEPYLDFMLAQAGFKVLERHRFQDHSVFYATVKTGAAAKSVDCPALYSEHRQLFTAYTDYHAHLVSDLNARVKASQAPVYLFGAHIFSQALLGFGLAASGIRAVLDNGPQKIGKRLYGTRLEVESPRVLRGQGRVNVILKAGAYNAEIKADILGNINPDVVFWE